MADLLRRIPSDQIGIGSAERRLSHRLHLDFPLLIALMLVCAGGVIVLYSATGQSSEAVSRQLARVLIGFVALFVIAQIPPRTYRYWAVPVFFAGLALLLLVLFIGIEAKGARRWFHVPGVGGFQPSELMKVALPVMVAWVLSRCGLPPRWQYVGLILIIIAMPTLLIAAQPDLGTAVLVAVSGFIVLFFAGLSWRFISLSGLMLMIAAPLMFLFALQPYQRRRVETLFNPEADPLGAGWNIIQSKIAIGSGGLTGKGWLNGTQSRLDFLPESSTDFILAVIGEEFGFVGILVLMLLYLFIVGRGLFLSWQAKETFGRLLGVSLSLTFLVYVVVNMGMVSGLLPVVGIPLPLISYGGTSIVTLLAGFGMLMSIHTHRRLMPPD